MEAGRRLLSSSPPPLHPPRKRPTSHLSPSAASPSSSVPVAHEEAAHAVTSLQTTSISRHVPASVLCREQCDDFRPSLHLTEDKTLQAILDRRRMENAVSSCEEQNSHQYHHHMEEIESQLLYWPGLWYLILSSSPEEKNVLPLSSESLANETAEIVDIMPSGVKQNISNSMTPWDVLSLAKKAAMVSKEAASLAENSFSFSAAELDPSPFQGYLLSFSVGANYMMPD
eukprot:TRINITY_DN5682_c0_g1_i14.p2 TRINITY_DN5682_c0_g1~~TRINITY_DN5682_c0_g1_i14.p2  ORF type:complete len:228 (-),score=63.18 TRINITY_DN5682_c0_g1_i14:1984-2667(-)